MMMHKIFWRRKRLPLHYFESCRKIETVLVFPFSSRQIQTQVLRTWISCILFWNKKTSNKKIILHPDPSSHLPKPPETKKNCGRWFLTTKKCTPPDHRPLKKPQRAGMGIRGIRSISSPTWLSTLEGAPWVTLTPGAPACMDHKGDREDWDWSQGFLVTEEFKMASFWHMFASFWHVGCFWFILHTNLSERNVLAEIIWVLRKSMMIKIYLGIIHHEFHQRSHASSCGDSKNWWIYGPQRRWRNHSWKNRHQRIRTAPRYPKWHMCPSGRNSHCFHITGG